MLFRTAILILSVGIAGAQSGVPAFQADRVLPSGGNRSALLVPGMLVSICGADLGPGRKSGFAFVAQAIEQNKFYRREMVQFIQDQFPELRGPDDNKVLAFLKGRL